MNDINLQNNQSNCIQTQNEVTGYNYINICTGTKTFVPLGSGDWLGFGLIFLSIIGGCLLIRKMWLD